MVSPWGNGIGKPSFPLAEESPTAGPRDPCQWAAEVLKWGAILSGFNSMGCVRSSGFVVPPPGLRVMVEREQAWNPTLRGRAVLSPDGSGGLGGGVTESSGRIGIKGMVGPAAVIVNCGAWCVWRPVAASTGAMG